MGLNSGTRCAMASAAVTHRRVAVCVRGRPGSLLSSIQRSSGEVSLEELAPHVAAQIEVTHWFPEG